MPFLGDLVISRPVDQASKTCASIYQGINVTKTNRASDLSACVDSYVTKTSNAILDIIQQYGESSSSDGQAWPGKDKFLPIVEHYVRKNESVKMVLPAFPFKSPNRKDKVMGSLPDLGEELALQHLNGLGESIAEVYGPGATTFIVSDGIVYNGMLN
jgi:pyoverdine/dityrosine biosynthesis protein Dit1